MVYHLLLMPKANRAVDGYAQNQIESRIPNFHLLCLLGWMADWVLVWFSTDGCWLVLAVDCAISILILLCWCLTVRASIVANPKINFTLSLLSSVTRFCLFCFFCVFVFLFFFYFCFFFCFRFLKFRLSV